jgi:release factor glutamine methyltransferase
MQQVRELIQQASSSLGSRLEAELLLARALGKDRAWLYAHSSDPVETAVSRHFSELVSRRADGEPVAYILGHREFFGREFQVTPAVLIPRPETELLVELSLGLDLPERCKVVDVGTGSGCIALSLAAEQPQWQIWATDISPEALTVARTNREALGLDRVEMHPGDLLNPVADQRFDLIVSNPPYVASGDRHLEQGDLRFEPDTALASGNDGLDTIKRLIWQACQALNPGGWLLIEHGHDQGQEVRALLSEAGFEGIDTRRDLASIERVSLGRRPNSA